MSLVNINQKDPDFFNREVFNYCTEQDISSFIQDIQKLGIQKTDVSPQIRKQRETHPRHYEPWSTKEMEVLYKIKQKTNDLLIFVKCLQRTEIAIRVRIEGWKE